MNIQATYQDSEKAVVNCQGDFSGSITRVSHLWRVYGIDALEKEGKISPYIEPVAPEKSHAQTEHNWVIEQLELCDLQMKFHHTNDTKRATHTLEEWKVYAVSLRDYTTVSDDGTITVTSDTRPTI